MPTLWGMLGYTWDFWNLMALAERRRNHHAWIVLVCRRRPRPNPFHALSRAVNGLWLRLQVIRQPCWSARRWKSLT